MTGFLPVEDVHLPRTVGYGPGLRQLAGNGHTSFGHAGTVPGYTALAEHFPGTGVTVAVLANLSVVDIR